MDPYDEVGIARRRDTGRLAEPDALFSVPLLASIYDELDGTRDDLGHYHAIIDELGARSVLDLGCGTGEFACRLARAGFDVTALDPAGASLDVARNKPGADAVRWIRGDAASTTGLPVGDIAVDIAVDGSVDTAVFDVVTMTGNVAQVFVDDTDWHRVVRNAWRALRPGGWLVFEVREPTARGWESWTKDLTFAVHDTATGGRVEHWTELDVVALPYVSFTHHYLFTGRGVQMASQSTLRFRSRPDVERSLTSHGFDVVDVRDAPDRPSLENVFIARRVDSREAAVS